MIEGLQIDLKSAELKDMLAGRLKYHEDKLANYKGQLAKLEEMDAVLGEEERRIGKMSSSGDPKQGMRDGIRKHSDQIIYYTFMVAHVVPNETYRLKEDDLRRLGLTREYY